MRKINNMRKIPTSVISELEKLSTDTIKERLIRSKELLNSGESTNVEFTKKWIVYYERYLNEIRK